MALQNSSAGGVVEILCMRVCYLSGLFAGCLEFSLLASLSDFLVLGQAVGVLRVHRVVFLPQDLAAKYIVN